MLNPGSDPFRHRQRLHAMPAEQVLRLPHARVGSNAIRQSSLSMGRPRHRPARETRRHRPAASPTAPRSTHRPGKVAGSHQHTRRHQQRQRRKRQPELSVNTPPNNTHAPCCSNKSPTDSIIRLFDSPPTHVAARYKAGIVPAYETMQWKEEQLIPTGVSVMSERQADVSKRWCRTLSAFLRHLPKYRRARLKERLHSAGTVRGDADL